MNCEASNPYAFGGFGHAGTQGIRKVCVEEISNKLLQIMSQMIY